MRSHTHMHRRSFTAADKATSAYLSAFAFACAREPCPLPLQMLVLCLCSVCAGKSFRLRRMFALFSVLFYMISFHIIFFFRSVFAWLAHLRRFDMLPGSCPFFAALPLPLWHSTLSHTPCGAMVLACCLRPGLWLVPLPALPGPKPFGPVAKWAT